MSLIRAYLLAFGSSESFLPLVSPSFSLNGDFGDSEKDPCLTQSQTESHELQDWWSSSKTLACNFACLEVEQQLNLCCQHQDSAALLHKPCAKLLTKQQQSIALQEAWMKRSVARIFCGDSEATDRSLVS